MVMMVVMMMVVVVMMMMMMMMMMMLETSHLYQTITKPCIDSSKFSIQVRGS